METVKQIDENISALRGKAKELATRRATLEGNARLLENTRVNLRAKALRDNDEKATAALEVSHGEAYKLSRQIEDLSAEITSIEADVQNLLAERNKVWKAELISKIKIMQQTKIRPQAKGLDKSFSDGAAATQPHLDDLKELRGMFIAAGLSEKEANKINGDHIRRRRRGIYHDVDGTAHTFEHSEQTPYDITMDGIIDNCLKQIEPPSVEKKTAVNE